MRFVVGPDQPGESGLIVVMARGAFDVKSAGSDEQVDKGGEEGAEGHHPQVLVLAPQKLHPPTSS